MQNTRIYLETNRPKIFCFHSYEEFSQWWWMVDQLWIKSQTSKSLKTDNGYDGGTNNAKIGMHGDTWDGGNWICDILLEMSGYDGGLS